MRSEAYKAKQRAYKRDEYRWYSEHGICVYCHQADAVTGMKACPDCLYKRNMRKIEKSSDEQRKKDAEKHQQRRARHKAQGLCTECNNPALEGQTRCKKCTMLHRMYDRQTRVYCVPDMITCCLKLCNEPVMQGKRYCEKHYKEKCAVMMKNRCKSNTNHIWRHLDSAMYKGV